MNGHVNNMHFQQLVERAATLLCFLLLLAVDSTKTVAAARDQNCSRDLQQTLRLTRLIHKTTGDLIKTYKASEGEIEFFCKASVSGIPDPNISGLDPSEKIASMYTQLQAFSPHLKRVYEQQMDLQPPKSQLLDQLNIVRDQSRSLTLRINSFYHNIFPNLPLPEPVGGPTTLPPPQNIFQQKVYGCVVLTTYKKLLANMSKNIRTLRSKVCRKAPTSEFNFFR